jgi:AraC-like DNA-binding protein
MPRECFRWAVGSDSDLLAEIRRVILNHARPDLGTPIPGLLLAEVQTAEPDHSLTEPLFVLMAQGGKRLLLGDEVFEYRAGQCLVVTSDLPVTGHFIGASRKNPSLAMGLMLRPAVVTALLLETGAPPPRPPRTGGPKLATCDAWPELLDAVARLLRLLRHPDDAGVLGPLIEREIHWRLVTGPHGAMIRQIGLTDGLTQVNPAIRWIRDNCAEPMRIEDLARLTGLSRSAFHRHFHDVTTMSPLQFQKRVRLQEARALLVAQPNDVAGVGHLVGYDSPSQFNREYRRLFGAPPGLDATRLRAAADLQHSRQLP